MDAHIHLGFLFDQSKYAVRIDFEDSVSSSFHATKTNYKTAMMGVEYIQAILHAQVVAVRAGIVTDIFDQTKLVPHLAQTPCYAVLN